jgi:hypothetical protein
MEFFLFLFIIFIYPFNFLLLSVEGTLGLPVIITEGGDMLPSLQYPSLLGLVILLVAAFLLIAAWKARSRSKFRYLFLMPIIIFGIYAVLAFQGTRNGICELVFDGTGRLNRSLCYLEKVENDKTIKDIGLCEKISNDPDHHEYKTSYYRGKCIEAVAERAGDPKLCDQIVKPWDTGTELSQLSLLSSECHAYYAHR